MEIDREVIGGEIHAPSLRSQQKASKLSWLLKTLQKEKQKTKNKNKNTQPLQNMTTQMC